MNTSLLFFSRRKKCCLQDLALVEREKMGDREERVTCAPAAHLAILASAHASTQTRSERPSLDHCNRSLLLVVFVAAAAAAAAACESALAPLVTPATAWCSLWLWHSLLLSPGSIAAAAAAITADADADVAADIE